MKTNIVQTLSRYLQFILAFSLLGCTDWSESSGRHQKRVVLPSDAIHNGWYFAAGDQVVIEGTVNGDAYIAGGVIEVDGTINGDLIVAGGMVTIGGSVSDDVRAAGGSITCIGKIGKDVTVAGGSVTVAHSAAITGNILAAGGNIILNGNIGREAKVAAGDAGIGGSIKGDVEFAGDMLTVHSGAVLDGNLRAFVQDTKKVEIASNTVHGSVNIEQQKGKSSSAFFGFQGFRIWFTIFWMLSLVFTALCLTLLAPNQLKLLGSTVRHRLDSSLLWGILGLIVIPVAAVLMMATIIGIPAGLFLLFMYGVMIYCSFLALGYYLGDILFDIGKKRGGTLFLGFAVGVVIVQAAACVPYVGFIVNLVSIIVGVGAMLVVMSDKYRVQKLTQTSPV